MVARVQLCAGVGDGQFIRFVFAEFLDRFAAVVGVDLQRGGGAGLGRNGIPVCTESCAVNRFALDVERWIVAFQ